jgi:hypothetical protein
MLTQVGTALPFASPEADHQCVDEPDGAEHYAVHN